MLVIEEFIEGAARLRGGAKALDIWRMAPWTDTFVTPNFLGDFMGFLRVFLGIYGIYVLGIYGMNITVYPKK